MFSTDHRDLKSLTQVTLDLLSAGMSSFCGPSRHHLELTPTIREKKSRLEGGVEGCSGTPLVCNRNPGTKMFSPTGIRLQRPLAHCENSQSPTQKTSLSFFRQRKENNGSISFIPSYPIPN